MGSIIVLSSFGNELLGLNGFFMISKNSGIMFSKRLLGF